MENSRSMVYLLCSVKAECKVAIHSNGVRVSIQVKQHLCAYDALFSRDITILYRCKPPNVVLRCQFAHASHILLRVEVVFQQQPCVYKVLFPAFSLTNRAG